MSKREQPEETRLAANADNPPMLGATMSLAKDSMETSRTGLPGKDQTQFPVPKHFGRYKIEKELGKGAMGVVYLAEDTQLGRKVALKIPKKAILEEPDALERFYREAKTTSLIRHPNICPVFDVGAIDGVHYLTMAYIPGKAVSSYIGKKLPAPRQVALLIRKLALALAEAHKQGVVHRDLKPANVMLDDRNEPIVMDFGLACQVNTAENARLTHSGAILGTPAYMAPEQVRGELGQIGPQSDIYALGVMMYQFLTGELPFSGPVMMVFAKIITEEPRRPASIRADIDPTLEAVCLKMMAKDVSERYAGMKDVADALTEFLKTGAVAGLETAVAETLAAASTVADEGIDWANLPALPGYEDDVDSLRIRKKKKSAEPKPTEPWWVGLRRQPWFWPAAALTLLIMLSPLLAAIVLVGVLRDRTPLQSDSARSGNLATNNPAGSDEALPKLDDSDLPPLDYAAERALAEWILDEAAMVSIVRASAFGIEQVSERSNLPAENFQVHAAHLQLRKSGTSWQFSVQPVSSAGWSLLTRTRLKELYLPQVPLTANEIGLLQKCTSLETLYAGGTGLTNTDLAALRTLRRLISIELQQTNVDNAGLRYLNNFPKLVSVRLDWLAVDDEGLRQLRLNQPTGLMLTGTAVTDRGLEHLDLSQLRVALLGATQVTDATIERLANPELLSLTAGKTAITGQTLDLLEACEKLSQLDIRSEQIAADRVREFALDHPECRITFLDDDGTEKVTFKNMLVNETPSSLESPTLVAPIGFAPVSPAEPAAARAAATWALSQGAIIAIRQGTQSITVTQLNNLPAGDLQLDVVNFAMAPIPLKDHKPISSEGWELLQKSGVGALLLPRTPFPQEDVSKLAQVSNLHYLSAQTTALTNVDLSQLTKLGRLHTLLLPETQVNGSGLVSIRAFRQLHWLDLNGLNLRDEDLKHLESTRLGTLLLSNTSIGDAGLAHLTNIPLTGLYLDNTKITDTGIELLPRRTLRSLILSHTAITDRAFDVLDNFPELISLVIQGQHVTPARARRFAQEHPGCFVLFYENGKAVTIDPKQGETSTPPTIPTDGNAVKTPAAKGIPSVSKAGIATGHIRVSAALERGESGFVEVEVKRASGPADKQLLKTVKIATGKFRDLDLSAAEPGDYFLYFTSPRHATQWRSITVVNGVVSPNEIDVTMFRKRYAIVRYVFNTSGSRELMGRGIESGRVAVSHWGKLPFFQGDWQVWQRSDDGGLWGDALYFDFHRYNQNFGFAAAPAEIPFNELKAVPDDARFQCEKIKLQPGVTLWCRVNGNRPEGIGYGKVTVEEVVNTPPKGLKIID